MDSRSETHCNVTIVSAAPFNREHLLGRSMGLCSLIARKMTTQVGVRHSLSCRDIHYPRITFQAKKACSSSYTLRRHPTSNSTTNNNSYRCRVRLRRSERLSRRLQHTIACPSSSRHHYLRSQPRSLSYLPTCRIRAIIMHLIALGEGELKVKSRCFPMQLNCR